MSLQAGRSPPFDVLARTAPPVVYPQLLRRQTRGREGIPEFNRQAIAAVSERPPRRAASASEHGAGSSASHEHAA
ncbi:hypothetical protein [Mycobacteroides abscessus]|jgi:hypothetical protein|uniref:hypothetical protein n=1 Tax=Mycobacteroides abscessus TaxID=36809 RepID=UPI0009A88C25|nr:hypothetical protein [Mycobacteroides abscessus]